MNFENYIKEVPARLMADLKDNDKNINHALMGIITEAGEIIDLYKKRLAYNKAFERGKLIDEVGDLMFYIGALMVFEKLDPNEVLTLNYQKLKTRFPEGFDEEKAKNPQKNIEWELFHTK